MLFKSSFIPLSAAMFFALRPTRSGKDYVVATLLFAVGLADRMHELREEECIKEQVRLE